MDKFGWMCLGWLLFNTIIIILCVAFIALNEWLEKRKTERVQKFVEQAEQERLEKPKEVKYMPVNPPSKPSQKKRGRN